MIKVYKVVSHYGSEACRLLWTVRTISGSLGITIKQYSWTVNSREIMSKKYRGTQEREKQREKEKHCPP